MTVSERDDYSGLIAVLRTLTLQQQQTNNELERLRGEVEELRARVEQQEDQITDRAVAPVEATIVENPSIEQSSTTNIVIGDTVVLNTQGRGKANRGTVTGTTVGGFLRITLENGQKIRRLPKNVTREI